MKKIIIEFEFSIINKKKAKPYSSDFQRFLNDLFTLYFRKNDQLIQFYVLPLIKYFIFLIEST